MAEAAIDENVAIPVGDVEKELLEEEREGGEEERVAGALAARG